MDVLHVSVSIDRPPREVYDFASRRENLPKWAGGLGGLGDVKIRFAERNDLGVLDHDVTLESGVTVHNPMRVVARGSGSEIIFTLFRQPGLSDEKFAEDARWVEKDLKTLKALLEK